MEASCISRVSATGAYASQCAALSTNTATDSTALRNQGPRRNVRFLKLACLARRGQSLRGSGSSVALRSGIQMQSRRCIAMAVQSSPDFTTEDASSSRPFDFLRAAVATAVAAVISAAAAVREAAEAAPAHLLGNGQQREAEEERLEAMFFDSVKRGRSPALLSLAAAAAVPLSIPIRSSLTAFISGLRANPTFMSAMIAWTMAQTLKVFTNLYIKRKFDLKMLVSSGGMPSSHTALCVAVTTSVAMLHGVGGPLFPVCLAFSSIIMYDATNVRYHAGVQAEVLNIVVEEMLEGHPVSEKKLKELLGHTPGQVVCGFLLGIITAVIYHIKTGQVYGWGM